MVAVTESSIERKWKLFLTVVFLTILEISISAAIDNTEFGILEWVYRRQISPDIYNFVNSNASSEHGINCAPEMSTYLISDQQCVKEQELFNGMLVIYTISTYNLP